MSIKIKESVDMDHIIQEALKGRPVRLRDGSKAYIRYKEDVLNTEYPIVGYIVGLDSLCEYICWTYKGKFFAPKEENFYDIVGLYREPLEFSHWDILDKRIKYIAKEANGGW